MTKEGDDYVIDEHIDSKDIFVKAGFIDIVFQHETRKRALIEFLRSKGYTTLSVKLVVLLTLLNSQTDADTFCESLMKSKLSVGEFEVLFHYALIEFKDLHELMEFVENGVEAGKFTEAYYLQLCNLLKHHHSLINLYENITN